MSPYAIPMLAASNLAKGVIDLTALGVLFGLVGLLVWAGGLVAERRKRN